MLKCARRADEPAAVGVAVGKVAAELAARSRCRPAGGIRAGAHGELVASACRRGRARRCARRAMTRRRRPRARRAAAASGRGRAPAASRTPASRAAREPHRLGSAGESRRRRAARSSPRPAAGAGARPAPPCRALSRCGRAPRLAARKSSTRNGSASSARLASGGGSALVTPTQRRLDAARAGAPSRTLDRSRCRRPRRRRGAATDGRRARASRRPQPRRARRSAAAALARAAADGHRAAERTALHVLQREVRLGEASCPSARSIGGSSGCTVTRLAANSYSPATFAAARLGSGSSSASRSLPRPAALHRSAARRRSCGRTGTLRDEVRESRRSGRPPGRLIVDLRARARAAGCSRARWRGACRGCCRCGRRSPCGRARTASSRVDVLDARPACRHRRARPSPRARRCGTARARDRRTESRAGRLAAAAAPRSPVLRRPRSPASRASRRPSISARGR